MWNLPPEVLVSILAQAGYGACVAVAGSCTSGRDVFNLLRDNPELLLQSYILEWPSQPMCAMFMLSQDLPNDDGSALELLKLYESNQPAALKSEDSVNALLKYLVSKGFLDATRHLVGAEERCQLVKTSDAAIALQLASRTGHYPLVQLLLESTHLGRQHDSYLLAAMEEACRGRHTDIARTLANCFPTSVTYRNDYNTALGIASQNGDVATVAALLARVRAPVLSTALRAVQECANSFGQLGIMSYIVSVAANKEADHAGLLDGACFHSRDLLGLQLASFRGRDRVTAKTASRELRRAAETGEDLANDPLCRQLLQRAIKSEGAVPKMEIDQLVTALMRRGASDILHELINAGLWNVNDRIFVSMCSLTLAHEMNQAELVDDLLSDSRLLQPTVYKFVEDMVTKGDMSAIERALHYHGSAFDAPAWLQLMQCVSVFAEGAFAQFMVAQLRSLASRQATALGPLFECALEHACRTGKPLLVSALCDAWPSHDVTVRTQGALLSAAARARHLSVARVLLAWLGNGVLAEQVATEELFRVVITDNDNNDDEADQVWQAGYIEALLETAPGVQISGALLEGALHRLSSPPAMLALLRQWERTTGGDETQAADELVRALIRRGRCWPMEVLKQLLDTGRVSRTGACDAFLDACRHNLVRCMKLLAEHLRLLEPDAATTSAEILGAALHQASAAPRSCAHSAVWLLQRIVEQPALQETIGRKSLQGAFEEACRHPASTIMVDYFLRMRPIREEAPSDVLDTAFESACSACPETAMKILEVVPRRLSPGCFVDAVARNMHSTPAHVTAAYLRHSLRLLCND